MNITNFPRPKASLVQKVKDNIAQVIHDERTNAGLSQEKLADLAGVDRKTINRIENGHFSPSIDTIYRIFTVLNISSSKVFQVK
jgi:DNA-binding XRE family transcriptional regulator